MSKIKKCKKSKKKIIMKGSVMLGIGLILVGNYTINKSRNTQIKNDSSSENVGVIKNGDELIPFYYDKNFMLDTYYFLENGNYMGSECDKCDNHFSNVIFNREGDILFTSDTQVIFLGDSYPNVYIDYEVISKFNEDTYQKYADNYLENVAKFDNFLVNIFEIENFETEEIKTIVGYKVSDTQIFNFETYTIEEYKGNYIACVMEGKDLEQRSFSYNEVLNMLEEYKGNRLLLKLNKIQ